jgi:hypothetical protein
MDFLALEVKGFSIYLLFSPPFGELGLGKILELPYGDTPAQFALNCHDPNRLERL